MDAAALIKTSAYLGAVLLVGAGVLRHAVGAGLAGAMARTLGRGALAGALVLIAAGFADVIWSVARLVGQFDPALTYRYLGATTHGRLTLLRVGLALGLLLLELSISRSIFRSTRVERGDSDAAPRAWAWALLAAGLVLTFSALSHGAAMHGAPALAADALHFGAGLLWGGAVLYTALSPAWADARARPALTRALGRVSSLGLASVLVLGATGVYAGLLHVHSPAALSGTPYGRALALKVLLVALTLGLAAFNRWRLLPLLRAGGAAGRFGRVMKLEALLLLAVLAATGLLTTRALPH